jgi:hypothetical protein
MDTHTTFEVAKGITEVLNRLDAMGGDALELKDRTTLSRQLYLHHRDTPISFDLVAQCPDHILIFVLLDVLAHRHGPAQRVLPN